MSDQNSAVGTVNLLMILLDNRILKVLGLHTSRDRGLFFLFSSSLEADILSRLSYVPLVVFLSCLRD